MPDQSAPGAETPEIEAIRERASRAIDAGDWQTVADECRRGVEIAPDDAWMHESLGASLLCRGGYDEARRAYEKLVELAPSDANAFLGLSDCFYQLEDFHQAESMAGRAIELEPDCGDAWCVRGGMRFALGDFPGAINDLTRAVELQPRDVRAMALLARSLVVRPRPKPSREDRVRASRLVDQAMKLNDQHPEAVDNLAIALWYLGRAREALPLMRRVLAVMPEEPGAILALGKILILTGRVREGMKYVFKCARLIWRLASRADSDCSRTGGQE